MTAEFEEHKDFQKAVMECVSYVHRAHDYGVGVAHGEGIDSKGIADLLGAGVLLWRRVVRMSPAIRAALGSNITFDGEGNAIGGEE